MLSPLLSMVALTIAFSALLRKLQGHMKHNTLVALRDVNMTVARGERVGVIGANGAGRSSLFRLVVLVRRPTEGRVVVRGRVAPLLELGLGFHGELTGRENVVPQGALMGFSREQMLERMEGSPPSPSARRSSTPRSGPT